MDGTLGGAITGRDKTAKPTMGVQAPKKMKQRATAPALQTQAPQPSQALSMADMLGALEEYAAPRAAPQEQPMEVERARAMLPRVVRERPGTRRPGADLQARKAAKMQREQEMKQRKLLEITKARQQGIPVETLKAIQFVENRIKYATVQMEKHEELIQSLEQRLVEARAQLEEKEEEVLKQNALYEYVLGKGKAGVAITIQDIQAKGMEVMEGGKKKKTQRRRRD